MQIHKLLFIVFAAAVMPAAFIVSPAICDADLHEFTQQVVTGTISSLDWVGSTLTLDRIVDLQHDQIRFTVTNDTKIYKGSATIMFSDLNMWDRVKIVYYNDAPAGGLKVISITVQR